jgi:hypothetical protein
MSPTPKVTGPASYFPSIEKKTGGPSPSGREHAMGHGHANALVGHTLREDAE